MAKLIWGADGERMFEAGVDHGVLYVPGLTGVPWLGLKAVKEAPTGGVPQPYYLDGYKYANIASSEEFEATIEAFSAPKEFALCEGGVQLAAGLIATQQPRKTFGMSYRTHIGNDINGLDAGYKIHLIYNALAAPGDRTNTTLSGTIDPMALSFGISTRPPAVAFGYKPTAHFVIDSRTTPKTLLKQIEDILYGTSTMNASLPEASELVAMFTGPGPYFIRNLIANPSFEDAGAAVVVNWNLALDPNGMLGNGFSNNQPSMNTTTYGVAITNHPQKITRAVRSTLTAGHAPTSAIMSMYNIDNLLTGTVFRRIGAWMMVTAAGYQGKIGHNGTYVPMTANTWVFISSDIGFNAGSYSSAWIEKISGNAADADQAFITGVTAFAYELPTESVWGGREATDDRTFTWTSTANNSPSITQGLSVGSVVGGSAACIRSQQWASVPSYSMRIIPTEGANVGFGEIMGGALPKTLLKPSTTYTILGTLRLPVALKGALTVGLSLCLLVYLNDGIVPLSGNYKAPNVAGIYELRATFTTPSSLEGYNSIRLYNGAKAGDGEVYWDQAMLVEGVYTGPYIDGNGLNTALTQYKWEGLMHKSVSRMSSWDPIPM